ncbi:MAG: hypothetical protein KF799_11695 [Bdellovibrionales bacterium]|nr:hypothetical protein [Bdellovibrionales bacterium]
MRERIWKMGLLGLVLSFIISSNSSFAKTDVIEKVYTIKEIAGMDLDELFSLGEEFNAPLIRVNKLMKRTDNENADIAAIVALARFPIQESQLTLYALLRSEFKKGEGLGKVEMLPEVITAALDTLKAFGTGQPNDLFDELLEVREEATKRLKGDDGEIVAAMIDEVLDVIGKRKDRLIHLNDRISARKKQMMQTNERLKRIQDWMEKHYKGQPEIVEGFLDLEWRRALYGKTRNKPDAIYMMGLPGTGKDTGAEVFTDAIHGYKGAHKTHLFRMPLMKSKADTWQVFGSATGYVGSESFPPFLAFLVQHSGGKYKLEKKQNSRGEDTFFVVENTSYSGETLEGYFSPESAVVFVNEFHNWSKQLKDDVIKQALEKGLFHINNPNGGLSEISVPVRFVLASNEGIRLLTSREANGQRHGKQMTYEHILNKWEVNHNNKPALKNEILATNGSRNSSVNGEGAPGISEELLNRIPDRFIFLLRPLSPADLKDIAELGLVELSKSISDESGVLGKVKLAWSRNLIDLIQEYDYLAEENARPILGHLGTMVEDPLIDAIKSGKLKNLPNGTTVELDVKLNADKTRSLIFTVNKGKGATEQFEQQIRQTLKDIPKEAISDSRIDQLSGLEEALSSVVFGIDPILKRLSQRVISIQNEAGGNNARPVNVMMLTGLSSTGKTETAKQLSRLMSGSNDELLTFDFSNIQTLSAFQEKILGLKDGLGNPIPSEFMKYYDRNNGCVTVAFDELANVQSEVLLKTLYDFFREPVVGTFSDGKPRGMGCVTVIITGNAGQELYTQVPSSIPMEAQMHAWSEIFKRTANDPALQRRVLEKTYPGPLVNRIGMNNIFFVPPHTYKSLRQLAQLKLHLALERLADTNGRRGWNITFPTTEEYKGFVTNVINEGFDLRAQGASIDSFIRDDFEEPVKYLLLRHKVPSGSHVVLKFRNMTDNHDNENPGYITYDVYVDGQSEPLEYQIRRPYKNMPMEKDESGQIFTAYHEAGHSLVREALNDGVYEPYAISIIPGVTMIGADWIYYDGIAKHSQRKEVALTRDWVIREIAALAAGETAERLASRGENHTAGKENDFARASRLAKNAILRYGLSGAWGVHSVPTDQTEEKYLDSLSQERRNILEKEVAAMVNEGRDLAQQTLEANLAALGELAVALAEKGTLEKDDLAKFYKEHTLINPRQSSRLARTINRVRTKINQLKHPRRSHQVNAEVHPAFPQPRQIADIDQMAEEAKHQQFEEVALPDKLPVGTNAHYDRAHSVVDVESCEGALAQAI